MTPDWTPLERELGEWAKAGLTLPLWWRDDDAIETTAALDRLNQMAAQHGIPVHLAVIPLAATPGLAGYVANSDHLIAVVHGWAHQNHAGSGEKKAEFGANRPVAEMLADVSSGLAQMKHLFGPRLCPMFVPPWNRITAPVAEGLAPLGFTTLSTFTPRAARFAAPGLEQLNTHLDPIAWKAGRGLVPPDALITSMIRQLQDRRNGQADNREPYGILTHHLVHDTAIWAFTDALLARLVDGPTQVWAASETPIKGPRI